jgi:hypothetical protein
MIMASCGAPTNSEALRLLEILAIGAFRGWLMPVGRQSAAEIHRLGNKEGGTIAAFFIAS